MKAIHGILPATNSFSYCKAVLYMQQSSYISPILAALIMYHEKLGFDEQVELIDYAEKRIRELIEQK